MLWLSFLFIFLHSASEGRIVQENECLSAYGWKGYCRPIRDCAALAELFAQGYQPEYCGFDVSQACCPMLRKQPSPKPLKRRYSSIFLKTIAPDDDTLIRISAIRGPLKRSKRKPIILPQNKFQGLFQTFDPSSYLAELAANQNRNELIIGQENDYSISSLKCQEYQAFAWETVSELSPYGGVVPISQEYCPRNRKEAISVSSELPFMVVLGYEDVTSQIIWACSGTLISKDFVLTAAHCLHPPLGRPKLVHLGSPQLDSRSIGEEISVSQVILHPFYNPADRAANLALIKLSSEPKLGTNLRPGCLVTNTSGSILVPFWKKDSTVSQHVSNNNEVQFYTDEEAVQLQKSIGAQVNMSSCASSESDEENYFCIESTSEGYCQTISEGGEPLIQLDRYNPCLHKIIGVAMDKSCSNDGPTLYTKIDPYLSWIEKTVWS